MSLRFWLLLAVLWFMSSPARAQVAIDWVPLNDGLEGDQVDMLWRSPRGTFFAGGAYSGLFRSPGYREPWEMAPLPKVHVREMTADSSGNVYAAGDEGVFVTADEGLTWRSTNLTVPVYALATTPNGSVFAGTAEGVYRQQAGESSFLLIKQWFVDEYPAGSHREPIEPITLMTVSTAGQLVVAAASHLYSTSDGDSWSCISIDNGESCWEKRFIDGVGEIQASQITTLSSFGEDLLIGNYVQFIDCSTSIYNSKQNDFISTPQGLGYKVFDETASNRANFLVMEMCSVQRFGGGFILFRQSKEGENEPWERVHERTYAVEVDENEEWICIGKNDGVHCSEDNGVSWTPWNKGLTNAEIRTLYQSNADFLFAGTRQGMYLDFSTNTDSWNPLVINKYDDNFDKGCISSPSAFADLPETGFMVMEGGAFHATDPEDIWQPAGTLDDTTTYEDRPAPRELPFCGVTFDRYVGSITDGCSRLYSKTLQSDGDLHYRGLGATLSYSSDGFVTSDRVNTPARYLSNKAGFFVTPITPFYFYSENLFWKSDDKGATWTQLPFPADSIEILDVVSNSDSVIVAGTTAGLYISRDAGQTWSSPVQPDQCFNLLTTNNEGVILAGDQLMSSDFGNTWQTIESPLTGYITAMTFDNAGTLYAGTRGYGVFKSADPLHLTSAPQQSTISFTATLYPNPAPDNFVLHLELPQLEDVRVDLYDLLGRHRGQLLNRPLTRGPHYLPLERAGVASGSYVVRVSTGTQTQHLKLVFR